MVILLFNLFPYMNFTIFKSHLLKAIRVSLSCLTKPFIICNVRLYALHSTTQPALLTYKTPRQRQRQSQRMCVRALDPRGAAEAWKRVAKSCIRSSTLFAVAIWLHKTKYRVDGLPLRTLQSSNSLYMHPRVFFSLSSRLIYEMRGTKLMTNLRLVQ